jgi:hypothetical protein
MQVNGSSKAEHVVIGAGHTSQAFLVSERVIRQARKIGMSEREAVLRSFRATTAVFNALEGFSDVEKLSALMNVSAIVAERSIGWDKFAEESKRTAQFYDDAEEIQKRISREGGAEEWADDVEAAT